MDIVKHQPNELAERRLQELRRLQDALKTVVKA